MKQRTRTYLAAGMAAVITGAALPVAYGAGKDGTVQEDLGEIVVTATRSAKRDLEVPAATQVISAQEIHESGARNAAELGEALGVSPEFVPYVVAYYRAKCPEQFPPDA